MAYDNFDPQDKEICEAIEAGATDETLVEQFGVDSDKIAQLRGAVEAEKDGGEAPAEETPADEIGEGEPSGDVPAQPAEGEPEAGADAPAEAQPEGEATA